MSNETRRDALKIAHEIMPRADLNTILENAVRIEAYLANHPPASVGAAPAITKPEFDYFAQPMLHLSKVEAIPEWSGTAQDLARTINSADTIICKARAIGMTTFLTHWASAHAKAGKRVAYVAVSGGQAKNVQAMATQLGANFAVSSVNSFESLRGRTIDILIVDGLAYLPYAKESDFVNSILPCLTPESRVVYSSEPAQARGFFHELWTTSALFQKVYLTRAQPLFPVCESLHSNKMQLMTNLGIERYRNQFECEFRTPKE